MPVDVMQWQATRNEKRGKGFQRRNKSKEDVLLVHVRIFQMRSLKEMFVGPKYRTYLLVTHMSESRS